MAVHNNPPEFTENELVWLHDYLVSGTFPPDEPSVSMYFAVVHKLDEWRWPTDRCHGCGDPLSEGVHGINQGFGGCV